MTACGGGRPEGVPHLHVESCYQAGRRAGLAEAAPELEAARGALADLMREHRLTREARPVKIVRVRCPHREGLAYREQHPELGPVLTCLPCPCNERSEVLVEYDAVELPPLGALTAEPEVGQ